MFDFSGDTFCNWGSLELHHSELSGLDNVDMQQNVWFHDVEECLPAGLAKVNWVVPVGAVVHNCYPLYFARRINERDRPQIGVGHHVVRTGLAVWLLQSKDLSGMEKVPGSGRMLRGKVMPACRTL